MTLEGFGRHRSARNDAARAFLVSLLALAACSSGKPVDDGGSDGGPPDAGLSDGGGSDGGTPDGGDGGLTDAGTPDGGTPDGGFCVDLTPAQHLVLRYCRGGGMDYCFGAPDPLF
jgi:hypothetical protein